MNTEMIRGGVESSTSKKKDPLLETNPHKNPATRAHWNRY